jgi:DNA-binding protein WhiA
MLQEKMNKTEATFKDKAIGEILSKSYAPGGETVAFLAGVARAASVLHVKGRRTNLELNLSSYEECFRAVELLKRLYPTEFEIYSEEVKSGPKKGGFRHYVQIPSGFTAEALADLYVTGREGVLSSVPAEFVKSGHLGIYLSGMFVAAGVIYVPAMTNEEKKDGYHFELAFDDESKAAGAAEAIEMLGIPPKTGERGEKYIVYLKDKDGILQLLAEMNLPESALALRSIIDERETANGMNRAIICETANLDKTYAAASKQLLAIGIIEEEVGLDTLTPVLRETAAARLEYQQASMQELADILGITKNCLNHRLRKLVEISETSGK